MFNQYPYINENDLNLDYMLKHVKELMRRVSLLEEWRAEHEDEYQELKNIYDQVIAGNFTPEMIAAFYRWMEKNAINLVGSLVKLVLFGLTDDGYFVAYIPENWSEIEFRTSGLDDFPIGVDYGHLILFFNGGI